MDGVTCTHTPSTVPHEVRRVTDVFMQYGIPLGLAPKAPARKPSLAVAPDEAAAAETIAGAGSHSTCGIHPGGKWSVKRWPTEKFVELITLLEREHGVHAVVFTGPRRTGRDRARARARVREHDLPRPASDSDLAAVMSRLTRWSRATAASCTWRPPWGRRRSGIFGSSEPAVWFPYQGAGPYRAAYIEVECRPCHRHECPLGHTRCLNELAAATVVGYVRDVMLRAKEAR